MPLTGFEPAIQASEQPQTHALDRAATGIGIFVFSTPKLVRLGILISCIFVFIIVINIGKNVWGK
jgi:hypothetical protein